MAQATDKHTAAARTETGLGGVAVLQALPSLQRAAGRVRDVLNVAAALTLAGGRAWVASAGGPFTHTLVRAGAKHTALPLDTDNPLKMYSNARPLCRMIKRENISVIHALAPGPAWSAWIAARRTGRPFVTTYSVTAEPSNAVRGLRAKVMTRGGPVIAGSRFAAGHLNRVYGIPPERIRVIRPGIDCDRFDPYRISQDRIVAMANRWQLPDGVSLIIVPGGLADAKRHATLFEAVKRLQRQDICCLFMGSENVDGEDQKALSAIAARHGLGGLVRIVGDVDDMPAAYMLSQVVVCPPGQPEAASRCLIEAQALGRPVIAGNKEGEREVVESGRTGLLTPFDDADAVEAALEDALGLSVEERGHLRDAARSHVLANFSKAASSAATLQVYGEAVASTIGSN